MSKIVMSSFNNEDAVTEDDLVEDTVFTSAEEIVTKLVALKLFMDNNGNDDQNEIDDFTAKLNALQPGEVRGFGSLKFTRV